MTITPRSMKSFRYDAEALFPWSPADRPSAFKGGATSCTSTWWRVNCWAQAFGKMNQPKRPLETCEQMDRNGSETVYNCIVSHNDFRFSFNVSTLKGWFLRGSSTSQKTQWINKSTFTKLHQRIWKIRHLLETTNPWGGPFFRSWACVFVSLKLLRATILEKLLESDIISPETPLWLKWSVPSDMYDFIYSFEGWIKGVIQ